MYKEFKTQILKREIVTLMSFFVVSVIVAFIVYLLNKVYILNEGQNTSFIMYIPFVIFAQIFCYISEAVFNYLLLKKDYYKISKIRFYPITYFPRSGKVIFNFSIYDKLFYSNIYLRDELKSDHIDNTLIDINDGLNKIVVNLIISGFSWVFYIILGYELLICLFVYSLVRGIFKLLKFAKNGEFKYINDEYNLRAIHILISAILNMTNNEKIKNSLAVVLKELTKIKIEDLNFNDKIYVIALKCYIYINGVEGHLSKKEDEIVSRALEGFENRGRFIKLLPIIQYLTNTNKKIADVNDIYNSLKKECQHQCKSNKYIGFIYVGMLLDKKDDELIKCNNLVKRLFSASDDYYKITNLYI